MFVSTFRGQRLHGNSLDQMPMLNAPQRDQLVGKLLNRGRPAMDDEHLQTGVVIQMRVTGRDNQIVMVVLKLGQLFADSMRIVVIDQSDSSHHRSRWR